MIKTYNELLTHIEHIISPEEWQRRCSTQEYTDRKQVIFWFVAMQMAGILGDLNRKEMAGLFLDGIPKMSEAEVDGWLETLYCAEDWEKSARKQIEEEALQGLNTLIKKHFGVK